MTSSNGRRTRCSAMLLVLALSTPAAAQITQNPPGSVRGVMGGARPGAGRTPNLFDMTFDFTSGYEDNSLANAGDGTDNIRVLQSGYFHAATGALRYQRGAVTSFLRATGTGTVTYAQISGPAEANRLTRGNVALEAATGLTKRHGFHGGLVVAYEPAILFNALGTPVGTTPPDPGLPPDQELPVQGPGTVPTSVTTQQWLSTSGWGTVHRNWTPRQRTDVGYTYWQNQPIEGQGGDGRMQGVLVRHGWNFSPTKGVEFRYRFFDNSQSDEGNLNRPLSSHALELAGRYERRFSPTRRILLNFGGGAIQSRLRTLNEGDANNATGPSIFGTAQYDFTTTWTLTGNVRRDISVLNGVTNTSFSSTTAAMRLSGTIARRLRTDLLVDNARGSAQFGGGGEFDSTRASAQLQYGLTRHIGMVVNYIYYKHSLEGVTVTAPSFPTSYSRQSIRVGAVIWLPLYGAF